MHDSISNDWKLKGNSSFSHPAHQEYAITHDSPKGNNSSKPRRTNSLSKKALFFTSVLFYWALFFKLIVGSFSPVIFSSAIIGSFVWSFMGNGWGMIDNIVN